jgi:histidinol-phosphate phosphatase family protein
MSFDVVVPTVGRDSLARLLDALAASTGPLPGRVLLVDDRRDRAAPLLGGRPVPGRLAGRVRVVAGRAAGPAAARNLGWRAARASWVAFLDDDVVPSPAWLGDLAADLAGLGAEVAGSQGRVRVPMPEGRRPTDWERNVRGLETARWATADMAYRRAVLAEVGGFDERFPRAYREDADLALRVMRAGYRLVLGRRGVTHPVRAAGPLVSVRLQAGNGDDVLLRALHGRGWRDRAGVPRGRRGRHLVVTGVGLVGVGAWWLGRRGVPTARWARRTAVVAGVGWLVGTVEFAATRIAAGPRDPAEVGRMVATSLLIPPMATWHWVGGWVRLPRLLADGERAPGVDREAARVQATPLPRSGHGPPRPPRAVLFDRDGTLVVDVPYNGDPERVVAMPGAREAVARLRAAGVATAVVSNQSGVARGLIGAEQVKAVNRRVDELVGPLGPWLVCLHGPGDGCGCRKPAPGLVVEAAAALGVEPRDCVVIGDVGADVGAARAAGARSVLVPTAATRAEEVAAAPQVAADLLAAVELLLGSDEDGVAPGRGAG